MAPPRVSIVTSFYNGGALLRPSLESILGQSCGDLELIAVDDGSTDGSRLVLEDFARRDRRVRVIGQDHQGLTPALIRGCSEARGEFIARHDADDLSLPGRLERQAERLASDPDLAMVSSWVRVIGPREEALFETKGPTDWREATRRLSDGTLGPYHGSVMFRAECYRRAGGYRAAFGYAQDWDLWLRMVDAGGIAYVPALLYAFRVSESSIGAFHRAQQRCLAALAVRCREARKAGEPEADLLEEAAGVSCGSPPGRAGRGLGNAYFIGRCLLDRRDPRALAYLRSSARAHPVSLRPWLAIAAAWLLCRPSSVASGYAE